MYSLTVIVNSSKKIGYCLAMRVQEEYPMPVLYIL